MNPKTRIVEGITPEALILALHHTDRILTIKCDELRGFMDKVLSNSALLSNLCSAHTGEDLSNTTIDRGNVDVKDSRLSLMAAVQPNALKELVQGPDYQGLFPRLLYFPTQFVSVIMFFLEIT